MSNHSFWSPTARVNKWQPTSKPELYHHGVKGMKWGVRKDSARQAQGTDGGGGGYVVDPEYLEWKKKHPDDPMTYEEWARRNAENDVWFQSKVDNAAKNMTPEKAYRYGVYNPLIYELENRENEAVRKSIGDDREGSIRGRDWHYEKGGRTSPARSGPSDNYEDNFIREKRVKDAGKKTVDTTNSALDKKHNAEKKIVTDTANTVKNTTKKRKNARTGLGRLVRK